MTVNVPEARIDLSGLVRCLATAHEAGALNAAERSAIVRLAAAVLLSEASRLKADAGNPPLRPTRVMQRVSEYLEAFDAGASFGEICHAVSAKSVFVRAATDTLTAEGHIRAEPGGRSGAIFTSVRPYRETDDTTPA